MAEGRARSSSFSRNPNIASTALSPGLKPGPNGTIFVSSGIPDLDKILGGGFCLGSLVMVMEDPEAPHHMLLLRNFMAQGLIHNQPFLYASPSKDPRGFLGTLPSPLVSKDDKSCTHGTEQDKNLRIAWQYKKYFDGNQQTLESRDTLAGKPIECISTQDCTIDNLLEGCSAFIGHGSRHETSVSCSGRIAIQSFCAPQCGYYNQDWDMLSFIKSLKYLIRSSNAVAIVSYPHSVLSPSFSKRWQHLADTVISVRAIPGCIYFSRTMFNLILNCNFNVNSDEDKELSKLLTGYQDMVGLLNVQKVARMNTQV
ncbi:hypothetical protein V2J09_022833 [Rumex salicifolius]